MKHRYCVRLIALLSCFSFMLNAQAPDYKSTLEEIKTYFGKNFRLGSCYFKTPKLEAIDDLWQLTIDVRDQANFPSKPITIAFFQSFQDTENGWYKNIAIENNRTVLEYFYAANMYGRYRLKYDASIELDSDKKTLTRFKWRMSKQLPNQPWTIENEISCENTPSSGSQ